MSQKIRKRDDRAYRREMSRTENSVDRENVSGVPPDNRESCPLTGRNGPSSESRRVNGLGNHSIKERSQEGDASSAVMHSLDGLNQEEMNDETREDCMGGEHNSEHFHVLNSDDSGFNYSSGDELCREGSSSPTDVHSFQEPGDNLGHGFSKNANLPCKLFCGTSGKTIKLISNCFPIELPRKNVYHYDVEVYGIIRDPEIVEITGKERRVERYRCLLTKEKRRVIESMVRNDAIFDGLYPAYDGEKNLYTIKQLHASFPHTYSTPDEDDIRARVKLKPTKRKGTLSCAINLGVIHEYYEHRINSVPIEAIVALETILRHSACLRLTPIGRSFFSPPRPDSLNPLAGGLEIWFGYHQSVRLGHWKPTVNIDISATTFNRGGSVLGYMAEFLDTTVDSLRTIPHLSDSDRKRLNRRLKDKKILATHSPHRRKYTILELKRENAHDLHLDPADGSSPTVAEYIAERYNIALKYPNLPCLWVSPRNRNVYLPIELCILIPGQHYRNELTRAQKAEMIKFTSVAPKQRFQKIRHNFNFGNDRCAQEFGVEVSEVPLHVDGRTLDPPTIMYRGEKIVHPCDGSWNMRGAQFTVGADIKSWILLSFSHVRRETLEKFARLFKERGQELGVGIGDHKEIRTINHSVDTKELFSTMKEEVDLALVVINESDESLYRNVKKSAETKIGLITQCVIDKNIKKVTDPHFRGAAQILSNLFLKINSKMGGVNCSLILHEIPQILHNPTIIIGADVTHPGGFRGFKDSLAACAGSLDARCSLYAVRTSPQKNEDESKKSVEIILDLKSMVVDLLKAFYRHTRKKKPEKIVIYRDGVSEGELLKVRDVEVRSVREACIEIGADYHPAITFIVVQKRHHVRFMTEGSNLNVPPGTVIDTEVTNSMTFDFFLSSQKSLKGTAKPAHYTVIEDDNGFTANELQKFTNQLCYTNVRCTKSIAIPAPVAYAHLAAYRARQYMDAGNAGSSASSDDSAIGGLQPSIAELIDCTTVVDELKNRMYFV